MLRVIFVCLACGCAGLVLADDLRDAKAHIEEREFEAAAEILKSLSQIGNGEAAYRYAELIEKDRLDDSSVPAALAWFRLADDLGYAKAARKVKRLARQLDEPDEVKADALSAELIEVYGAEAFHEDMRPELGGRPLLSIQGDTAPEFKWPTRVTRGRHPATVVALEFDLTEQGRPRDIRLVEEAWPPLAEATVEAVRKQNYPDAYGLFGVQLSWIFSRHDGREQYQTSKLLKRLRRSAETGSPYRKYRFAYAQELAEHFGYVHSQRDSDYWYLQAAKGGYAKAQYVVGRRLLSGWGVKQSTEKGMRWVELAVRGGDPQASYLFARVALLTRGEVEVAREMLRVASDAGHTTASLWLARLIAPHDPAEARRLLEGAKAHLDQVSWNQVAAEVYADDPERARAFSAAAEAMAAQYGVPIEPLASIGSDGREQL